MRSDKQIEASRQNGSRSRGPITPEGKANSSRNATRHGFYSSNPVLSTESQADFDEHLADFVTRHRPASRDEYHYVRQLAVCSWQIARSYSVEAALIDYEMDSIEDKLRKTHKTLDDTTLMALAYRNLDGQSGGLNGVQRHQVRLTRQMDRALTLLQRLQAKTPSQPAPNPEIENFWNEPKNLPEPPSPQQLEDFTEPEPEPPAAEPRPRRTTFLDPEAGPAGTETLTHSGCIQRHDYQQLAGIMQSALAAFPEARQALYAALENELLLGKVR